MVPHGNAVTKNKKKNDKIQQLNIYNERDMACIRSIFYLALCVFVVVVLLLERGKSNYSRNVCRQKSVPIVIDIGVFLEQKLMRKVMWDLDTCLSIIIISFDHA